MQSAFNYFDSVAVTAITAASKFQGIITMGMFSVGQTMAAYAGQNYGARNMKRIRDGVSVPWEDTTGRCRVYGEQGDFLMLADCADGILTSVKNFF